MNRNAAVIGSPISHSLSPEIFSFLGSQVRGLSLNYRAIEVAPGDLRQKLFEFASDPNFVGLNVTVPHKESVLRIANHSTSLAAIVGAANVLHLENREWNAHNTDVFGVAESLREFGFQFYESQVLILGAGGAARAAAVALAQQGARTIDVFNRTYSRAISMTDDLSRHFASTTFFPTKAQHQLMEKRYDLIIQATPNGMSGIGTQDMDQTESMFKSISGTPVAFDLVYCPEETIFLKVARSFGLPTLGGIQMLVHQALATWNIWFPNLELGPDVSSQLTSHLRRILKQTGEQS